MKNLNKFYIFCLLLSVIFVACKKDDDNTSGSVVTLRGKYKTELSEEANFVQFVKNWVKVQNY